MQVNLTMSNYTNANNTLIIFARWRHHMVPTLYIVNDHSVYEIRSEQSNSLSYGTANRFFPAFDKV